MDGDDFEIDPALAASLGFSSFGAQPNTKRRKYNHNDAVTDVPMVASKPLSKSKNIGKGANATRLGMRDTGPPGDAAEDSASKDIRLIAGKSGLAGDTLVHRRNSTASAEMTPDESAEIEEQNAPATTPQPIHLEGPEGTNVSRNVVIIPGLGDSMKATAHTPSRTAQQFLTDAHSQGQPHDLNAFRNGVRLANGDMVYYLPSFIEDPWAHLPQSRGK